LFALVDRECVVSVWHEQDTWHDARGMDKLLHDAAMASPPTLGPLLRMFTMDEGGRPLADACDTFTRDETEGEGWELCRRGLDLARLHAETWQEELRAFVWLDADCRVSRSELAGGRAILVNRGDETAQIEGREVPARAIQVL
jgi:hypothetical protein